MPSPPFFKYLCGDISGEGTSAELMQCVRSRVTQSLTSPAALPLLQDATPAILQDVPFAAAGHCRVPEHLSPHSDTQYHLLLDCLWRTVHNSIFLMDNLLVLERSRANLSGAWLKQKKTCCCCTWGRIKYHWGAFHIREKIIISGWGSKQNPRFQRFQRGKVVKWTLRMHSNASQSRCLTSVAAPYYQHLDYKLV